MKTIHIYPNKKTVISLAGEEVISNAGKTVVIDGDFAQGEKTTETITTSARTATTLSATDRPKV